MDLKAYLSLIFIVNRARGILSSETSISNNKETERIERENERENDRNALTTLANERTHI